MRPNLWFLSVFAAYFFLASAAIAETKFNESELTLNQSQLRAVMANKKSYFKNKLPEGYSYKIPAVKMSAYVKNIGRVRFSFNNRRLNTWPGTEDGHIAFLRGTTSTKDGTYYSTATLYKTKSGLHGEIFLSGKRPFRQNVNSYTLTFDYREFQKESLKVKVENTTAPPDATVDEEMTFDLKAPEQTVIRKRILTQRAQLGPRTLKIKAFYSGLSPNHLLSAFGTSDWLFESAFKINIEIVGEIEYLGGPYTRSSGGLLSFALYTTQTFYNDRTAGAYVMFVPGPPRNVGLLGIAFLRSVCTTFGTTVTEPEGLVLAHELGHILGSEHDGTEGNLMNPLINNGGPFITQNSKDQIEANIAVNGDCLYDQNYPTPLPTATPDPSNPTPTPIAEGPPITPQELTANIGQTVGFHVQPDPNATYQWYKNDVLVPGEDDFSLTFMIDGTTTRDERYYVVVNGLRSDTAVLHVIAGPPVVMPGSISTGGLGTVVGFGVHGPKTGAYQWYKNGVAISGATNQFLYVTVEGPKPHDEYFYATVDGIPSTGAVLHVIN